jgi:hypothetical protein
VPGTDSISFSYREGIYTYDFNEIAVLTISNPNQAFGTSDTVSTSATFTYTIAKPGANLALIASIDSFAITSPMDSIRLDSALVLDLWRDSSLLSTGISAIPDSCDSEKDVARRLAGRILVRVPLGLNPGTTWQDTTHATTCRGGIPLSIRTVNNYRAYHPVDPSRSSLVHVDRTTEVMLSGSGFQGNHPVSVTGTGHGQGNLVFELARGLFLQSDGQSSLTLVFDVSGQTQTIHQTSGTKVRLRNRRF